MTALAIVQWAAIVVLYLALASVLREVRLLRAQVTRWQAQVDAHATTFAANPAGRLDARLEGVAPGRAAVVLVATSTCPLCRLVLERLDSAPLDPSQSGLEAVLLTYEDVDDWGVMPSRMRVVRDDAAWSQLAHLEPPLLARLAPDGTVVDLVLPVSERDVDEALRAWSRPDGMVDSHVESRARSAGEGDAIGGRATVGDALEPDDRTDSDQPHPVRPDRFDHWSPR